MTALEASMDDQSRSCLASKISMAATYSSWGRPEWEPLLFIPHGLSLGPGQGVERPQEVLAVGFTSMSATRRRESGGALEPARAGLCELLVHLSTVSKPMDTKLESWNWLWWECLHHGNRQVYPSGDPALVSSPTAGC